MQKKSINQEFDSITIMTKEDLFRCDVDGNNDEYDDEDGIGNFPRLNKPILSCESVQTLYGQYWASLHRDADDTFDAFQGKKKKRGNKDEKVKVKKND